MDVDIKPSEVPESSPNPQIAPETSEPPIPRRISITAATGKRPSSGSRKRKANGISTDKGEEGGEEEANARTTDINPSHTMTVVHTRRNANGTIGSVYSGNKIRHLKKDDGIPLWRKDIQYRFLRYVFEDERRVFTMASTGEKRHTFAEIYIDAMARSSKTSKVLKDKLIADYRSAISMAMVCLLVNVGRMNTTLNFFPEMRAQLRTYHSIPCLQADQDPNAYKQLQDAPRLKSILKGASEDDNQPNSIERIKELPVPRTNPVNLIFVLSQYAPKVSEQHFFPPRDFFDLVMRPTLSSESRANAFLWLSWYYLESDFSGADDNPFGKGEPDSEGDGPLHKVPKLVPLSEEDADAENLDTEREKSFGEQKREERKKILEEDETVGPPPKKGRKGATSLGREDSALQALSDTDRTRSLSPASHSLQGPGHLPVEGSDFASPAAVNGAPSSSGGLAPYKPPERFRQKGQHRLMLKTSQYDSSRSPPPTAPGQGHAVFQGTPRVSMINRRMRAATGMQKAINRDRKMRAEAILHKRLAKERGRIRKQRRSQTRKGLFGYTMLNAIHNLPSGYDSENDEIGWGPGGLLPQPREAEDYGEEASRYVKIIARATRRLRREDDGLPRSGISKTHSRRKGRTKERSRGIGPSESDIQQHNVVPSSDVVDPPEEGLDDLDLDLLGENEEEEGLEDEMDVGDETDAAEEVLDEANDIKA